MHTYKQKDRLRFRLFLPICLCVIHRGEWYCLNVCLSICLSVYLSICLSETFSRFRHHNCIPHNTIISPRGQTHPVQRLTDLIAPPRWTLARCQVDQHCPIEGSEVSSHVSIPALCIHTYTYTHVHGHTQIHGSRICDKSSVCLRVCVSVCLLFVQPVWVGYFLCWCVGVCVGMYTYACMHVYTYVRVALICLCVCVFVSRWH